MYFIVDNYNNKLTFLAEIVTKCCCIPKRLNLAPPNCFLYDFFVNQTGSLLRCLFR